MGRSPSQTERLWGKLKPFGSTRLGEEKEDSGRSKESDTHEL